MRETPVRTPSLPEPLPEGERVLWRGAPDWRLLALTAFHVRKVAIYFTVLMVLRAAFALNDGEPVAVAFEAALWLLPLALVALALLGLLAWFSARTTTYTITSRRLIMQVGMALPITLNLPFGRIEAADRRIDGRGAGDLVLTLLPGERVAYWVLWPHARPWHFSRPRPMLRALPDGARAGEILAGALAAALPSSRVAAGDGVTVVQAPPADAAA